MPFKSPAQAKLMRARAHGWKPDRIKGPSVKVAKEFVAADKKAKGMQVGGLFSAKKLRKMMRKQDPDYDPYARYGTEPLTLKQASKRVSSKTKRGAEVLTAKREMTKAGWNESGGKWYPPQPTIEAPGGLAEAATPARTIQPVAGREFISGAAPPRRVGPPARTAEEIAPGFRPGRVPATLLRYLERQQAIAAAKTQPEEPVGMQYGGFARRMRGRGLRGRGQPPGGGGLARAAVQPGGGQTLPMKGIGRAPGAGVPLRGVGRPPGMGRPGAGGARPTGPGAGGGVQAAVMPGRSFMPGGGGAGMPGGAPPSMRGYMQMKRQQMARQGRGRGPRIGMGDQQGALARATQVQTGRPPTSRRMAFPGRGGQGRLGRGRMRR